MKTSSIWPLAGLLILTNVLWGCGANRAQSPLALEVPAQDEIQAQSPFVREEPLMESKVWNLSWRERVITEKELSRLSEKDPDLTPSTALEILARLNTRARYYVADDIKNRQPLKVPNNFSAYKHWTPLPRYIPDIAALPKFILVVKDVPFLGWYIRGRLIGDSLICIGKSEGWTKDGIYKVQDKDADHISRSYTNAYGEPAPMPWALRIYEHVWIHAGDITGGYCSHGCLNLPLMAAQGLFNWANPGTPVMIVGSVRDVKSTLLSNRSNCTIYADACRQYR